MDKNFIKILQGYQEFRKKYALGDQSVMQYLSNYGQQPKIMVVSCCDSRVDPALILQCDPGDLFIVRNVANIIPPYEKDEMHHGTSAALEFGIRFLNIEHLILLGHSQCGGIQALLNDDDANKNDFIQNWVSLIKSPEIKIPKIKATESNTQNSASKNQNSDANAQDAMPNIKDIDSYAKLALNKSYKNCLTFPWINEKIINKELTIHLWFFDIKTGQIFTYSDLTNEYKPLDHKII